MCSSDLRAGYECVPVNPAVGEILGRRCHATLEDAVAEGGSFDIVDVFRRPEHVPPIAASAVATGCRSLWLQLGVISWEGARIAHEGGLPVVMDRCTAIELRRLGVSVEIDYMRRSLKSQMKMADKLDAGFAVVLGPDELAGGQVVVRNLATEIGRAHV